MKKIFIAAATIFAAFLVYAPILDNLFTTNQVYPGTNIFFTKVSTGMVVSASASGTINIFTTNTTAGNLAIVTNIATSTEVWTNDGNFVFLSGTGTNHPNVGGPGPPFVIRNRDGSLFGGTNVALDVSGGLTNFTSAFPWYFTFLSDSNEIKVANFGVSTINNESYSVAATVNGQTLHTAANDPAANWVVEATGSNFDNTLSVDRTWIMHSEPSLSTLDYQSNGVSVFTVVDNGNLANLRGVSYTWPDGHGTANSVLTDTNGSGVLTWTHISSTNISGGIVAGTNIFLTTNGQGGIVVSVVTNNLVGGTGTNSVLTTTAPLTGGGSLSTNNTIGIAIGPGTNTTFTTNAGVVTVGALPQTPWLQNEWMHGFSGTNGYDIQLTNSIMLTRPDGSGAWLTNQGNQPQLRLFQTSTNAFVTLSNGDLRLEATRVFTTNNVSIQQLGTNSATDVFDTYSQPGNVTVSISSTGTVIMAGSTNRSLQNVQPATLSIYGDGRGDNYSSPGILEIYGTNNLRLMTVSQNPLQTNDTYPYLYFFGATGGEGLENFLGLNFLGHGAGGTRYGSESWSLDVNANYFVHSINGDNGKTPYMDFSTANAIIDKPHIQASAGSVSFPGLTFNSATNYGFFRGASANAVTLAMNGFPVAAFMNAGTIGQTPGQPGLWLSNTWMFGFSTNIPNTLNPLHVRGPALYYFDDTTLAVTNSLYVSSNLNLAQPKSTATVMNLGLDANNNVTTNSSPVGGGGSGGQPVSQILTNLTLTQTLNSNATIVCDFTLGKTVVVTNVLGGNTTFNVTNGYSNGELDIYFSGGTTNFTTSWNFSPTTTGNIWWQSGTNTLSRSNKLTEVSVKYISMALTNWFIVTWDETP